ncbi:MAG TPA: YjbF family lipoprotein, partial [Paracoccaceae bacterium]|nr:YjbF family lipoprotein [Paracoccaceae bacterium]
GPLILVALLSACGNSGDEGAPARAVAGTVRAALSVGLPGPGPPTPAPVDLAALQQPVLEVGIVSTGAVALVVPVARSGRVVTFASADGRTISLRDGIVVATRGLGPDLMAADVPQLADLRPGAEWVRRHEWLDGLDQLRQTMFRCTAGSGPAAGAPPGRHLREVCEPAGGGRVDGDGVGGFVNDYRIGAAGRIVESSQWLGPGLGLLTIRSLSGLP